MAEQTVRIMCPNLTCRRVLSVPITARGKVVRCAHCKSNMRIPGHKTPGAPAAPADAKATADADKDAA